MAKPPKPPAKRRDVHYGSLGEFLIDAEAMLQADPQKLGSWSLGQICQHLAKAITCSVDGFPKDMKAPWYMRIAFFVAKPILKGRMLNKTLPSGFKIPQNAKDTFQPGEVSDEEGLDQLRTAINRFQSESTRAVHPFLGELTNEEWVKFHLRHAELHMSFLVA